MLYHSPAVARNLLANCDLHEAWLDFLVRKSHNPVPSLLGEAPFLIVFVAGHYCFSKSAEQECHAVIQCRQTQACLNSHAVAAFMPPNAIVC